MSDRNWLHNLTAGRVLGATLALVIAGAAWAVLDPREPQIPERQQLKQFDRPYKPQQGQCDPKSLAGIANAAERLAKTDQCGERANDYRVQQEAARQAARVSNATEEGIRLDFQSARTSLAEAILLFLTLCATAWAAWAASEASKAAVAAVDEAKSAVNLQQRPWVSVSVEPSEPVKFTEAGLHAAFKITLKNVGLTPAESVVLRLDFKHQSCAPAEYPMTFYAAELEKAASYVPEEGFALLPGEEITTHRGMKIFRADFGPNPPDKTYLFPLLMVSVTYRSPLVGGVRQTGKTYLFVEKAPGGGRAILEARGNVSLARLLLNERGGFARAT